MGAGQPLGRPPPIGPPMPPPVGPPIPVPAAASPAVAVPASAPSTVTVYSSPEVTPADDQTTDLASLVTVAEATTVPSEATSSTVSPAAAGESRTTETQPCVEELSGETSIPELPAASSVPPDTTKVPLTSRAPFPASVGPLTVTVPPVIVAEPLESSPSP